MISVLRVKKYKIKIPIISGPEVIVEIIKTKVGKQNCTISHFVELTLIFEAKND